MDKAADGKHICGYVCDVTNAASMELKFFSKTDAPNDLEICDIMVN